MSVFKHSPEYKAKKAEEKRLKKERKAEEERQKREYIARVNSVEIYAIENVDFKYEIKDGFISTSTYNDNTHFSDLLKQAFFNLRQEALARGADTIIGLKYSIATMCEDTSYPHYTILMTGAAVKRIGY